MKCWICGGKGETGEHLLKASDMKMLFPEISQKKPLYVHSSSSKNIKIGSRKSNRLKSNALICAKCNNQLTQPHDKAWEKTSQYISTHWDTIVKAQQLDLKDVFKHNVINSAVNFHLYFLKLLGCLLVESGNDEISSYLATSIISNKSHDRVFINFVDSKELFVGISDLGCTFFEERELVRSAFVYMMGNLNIRVVYVHPEHNEIELSKGWNPIVHDTVIKIENYSNIENSI